MTNQRFWYRRKKDISEPPKEFAAATIAPGNLKQKSNNSSLRLNFTTITVETQIKARSAGIVSFMEQSWGERIARLFLGPSAQISNERLQPRLDIGARSFAETLQSMSTIVIYEADDLMRSLLKEWLASAGYRVAVATPSGPPPSADLVIANVCMPKQAGSRAAEEIRAAHPGAPIIAISAQFRADLSSAGTTAQSLGVAQVIAKPLSRDTLLAAVRAIIDPAPMK